MLNWNGIVAKATLLDAFANGTPWRLQATNEYIRATIQSIHREDGSNNSYIVAFDNGWKYFVRFHTEVTSIRRI